MKVNVEVQALVLAAEKEIGDDIREPTNSGFLVCLKEALSFCVIEHVVVDLALHYILEVFLGLAVHVICDLFKIGRRDIRDL